MKGVKSAPVYLGQKKMKLDDCYEIELVGANVIKGNMPGDIYTDYQALCSENPHAQYMFGYCLIDVQTGCIADGAEDWYETVDAAISDWKWLSGFDAQTPQGCHSSTKRTTPKAGPSPRSEPLEAPQIMSAEECWNTQTNRTDFINACNKVIAEIRRARESGKRECLFNPRTDQYAAVKTEFEKKGYTFRPYGYSGGVWQDAEMICW